MLLKLYNLPPAYRYPEIKHLVSTQCGITDMILDNMVIENGQKQVTVGLAEEEDGAMIMRKLNGYFLLGHCLRVEIVGRKQVGETHARKNENRTQFTGSQPYHSNVSFMNQPPVPAPLISYPNIYGMAQDGFTNFNAQNRQMPSATFNAGQQESTLGFNPQSQALLNPSMNKSDWNNWGNSNQGVGNTGGNQSGMMMSGRWNSPQSSHQIEPYRDDPFSGNRNRGDDYSRGGNQSHGGSQNHGGDHTWGGNQNRGFGQDYGTNQIRGDDHNRGDNQNRGGNNNRGGNQIRGGDHNRAGNQTRSDDNNWGRNQNLGDDNNWGRNQNRDGVQDRGSDLNRGGNQLRGVGQNRGGSQNRGRGQNHGGDHSRGGNQSRGDNQYHGGGQERGSNHNHGGGQDRGGNQNRSGDRNRGGDQEFRRDPRYHVDNRDRNRGNYHDNNSRNDRDYMGDVFSHGGPSHSDSNRGDRNRAGNEPSSHRHGFNEARNAPSDNWRDRKTHNSRSDHYDPPSKRMKPNFDPKPLTSGSQGPPKKGGFQNQSTVDKQASFKKKAFGNNQMPVQNRPGPNNPPPFGKVPKSHAPFQKPNRFQTPNQSKPEPSQASFQKGSNPQKPGKKIKKRFYTIEDLNDEQLRDLAKKRAIAWRYQIGSTIAKEVLSKMKKGVEQTLDFKQALKFAIVERLTEMFEHDVNISMIDMGIKYREKYSVKSDAALIKQVADKVVKFDAEVREADIAAGRDPDAPKPQGAISDVVKKFSENLPKYPMADIRMAKLLKKENQSIFENPDSLMNRLEPKVRKALNEEFDRMCNAVKEKFMQNIPSEIQEYAYKVEEVLSELKKYLMINATKRLLSVGPIILRVFANPKMLKMSQVGNALRKYGVVSLRKKEVKGPLFYIATCETYKQHDILCNMGAIEYNGARIICKPFQLLGKFKVKNIEMKKHIQIEYMNRVARSQANKPAAKTNSELVAHDDEIDSKELMLLKSDIEKDIEDGLKYEPTDVTVKQEMSYQHENVIAKVEPKSEEGNVASIKNDPDVQEDNETNDQEENETNDQDINETNDQEINDQDDGEELIDKANIDDLDIADIDANDLEDY